MPGVVGCGAAGRGRCLRGRRRASRRAIVRGSDRCRWQVRGPCLLHVDGVARVRCVCSSCVVADGGVHRRAIGQKRAVRGNQRRRGNALCWRRQEDKRRCGSLVVLRRLWWGGSSACLLVGVKVALVGSRPLALIAPHAEARHLCGGNDTDLGVRVDRGVARGAGIQVRCAREAHNVTARRKVHGVDPRHVANATQQLRGAFGRHAEEPAGRVVMRRVSWVHGTGNGMKLRGGVTRWDGLQAGALVFATVDSQNLYAHKTTRVSPAFSRVFSEGAVSPMSWSASDGERRRGGPETLNVLSGVRTRACRSVQSCFASQARCHSQQTKVAPASQATR